MQFTNKFTIGIHIVCAINYFKDKTVVTSALLASSTGANPVVARTVMSSLKEAKIINISQGKTGIGLLKKIEDISFYDVYVALDCLDDDGLFHFHENPNPDCPIGRNIHKALDQKLKSIQKAMEEEMKKTKLSDVYESIISELEKGK